MKKKKRWLTAGLGMVLGIVVLATYAYAQQWNDRGGRDSRMRGADMASRIRPNIMDTKQHVDVHLGDDFLIAVDGNILYKVDLKSFTIQATLEIPSKKQQQGKQRPGGDMKNQGETGQGPDDTIGDW